MERSQLEDLIDAKLPQKSAGNAYVSDLNLLLKAVADSAAAPAGSALTTSGDGVAVPADAEYVVVTSGNSSHVVTLPPLADVVPGQVIQLEATATAFKLAANGTEKLNDVAGPAAATIPATGLAICRATSAGWLLMYLTELGAVATAIVPA